MVKYKQVEIGRIFHALADPTRREIIHMVSTCERQASELAASFDISFPAVSKHLRVLENAGLINRRIQGRIHRFRIKPDAMKEAYDWLHDYGKVLVNEPGATGHVS